MSVKGALRLLSLAFVSIVCTSIDAVELPLDHCSIPRTRVAAFEDEVGPIGETRIEGVLPTPLFVNDSGVLCQVVVVGIENGFAEAVTAFLETRTAGKDGFTLKEVVLPPGMSESVLFVPDHRRPVRLVMSLSLEERLRHRIAIDWEPARLWRVYVDQMSHFDHGYTGTHDEVMGKRDRILDDVLDYCLLTDDWPEESKFRWHVESSICAEHYLESRPWREEELGRRISQGRIEIGAKYCAMHPSTAGHEEIVRNIYHSMVRLSERFGVDIITAHHTDVGGSPWGSVAAWTGAGIRYFLYNPNLYYRGANILHATEMPQAYYWEGPGDARILAWRSRDGYEEADFLIEGLDRTLVDLPLLLESLESEGYSYDALHLTQTGLDEGPLIDFRDNASPRFEVCDTIRRWNEIFEYPKLICSTTSMFFQQFEEDFAGEIPALRGDTPDWWADGVGTGAVAEGRVRRLHHKLGEAESLASAASVIDDNAFYPRAVLEEAWEKMILFDEHTWGAWLPFLPPHGEIWGKKVEGMEEAHRICDGVMATAVRAVTRRIRGDGWRLFVFNALGWDRDDVVWWQPPAGFPQDPLGSDFFQILDAVGEQVPFQMAVDHDGSPVVVFIAEQVPSIGYRTYRIVPSDVEPLFQSSHTVGASSMENDYYRVDFDAGLGVTGLRDLGLDRELVDGEADFRLNEFISRRQGLLDLWDIRERGRIDACSLDTTGPVYASLLSEVSDPAHPSSTISQEIRLYDGLKRIDFINRTGNFHNSTGQSNYFAFPFEVPDFEFRLDIPLAVMRPYHEQLPDHAKHYATQHWIDVSSANGDFGITWAAVESPIVELGDITKPSCWWAITPPLNYDPGIYPYDPGNPHIYSEIMNNFHNTNFNYFQDGSGTWQYAMTTHTGSWDQPEVTRFGWGLSSPLMAELFEADRMGILPDSLSFLRVDRENVKVLAMKAAEDGDGLVVRLFENEGRPTRVRLEVPLMKNLQAELADHVERATEVLASEESAVSVDIGAFDLVTIRIDGELAWPAEVEEEDGSGGCGCAMMAGPGDGRLFQLAVIALVYLLPAGFIVFRLKRLRLRSDVIYFRTLTLSFRRPLRPAPRRVRAARRSRIASSSSSE